MSAAETPGGALVRASSTGSPETSLRTRPRAGRRPAATGTFSADVATPSSHPPAAPAVAPGVAPAVARVAAGHRLHDRQVLVVGHDRSSAAGSAAPYTSEVAEHLATLAAGVTVLAAMPEDPTGPPGPTGPTGVAGPVRRIWRELTAGAAVALAGRRVHADLVVAVTPSPGGAAAAAWIATRRGIPLITLVQGMVTGGDEPATFRRRSSGPAVRHSPGHGSRRRTSAVRRAVARVEVGLERYALRAGNEVVVASEAFRPAALAAGVDPAHLHLLPAWTRPGPPARSRLEARAVLGWPADRFTVVHAGAMSHRQDLATVVEAAGLLAARLDDVRSRARHHADQGPGGRRLVDWDQCVRAGSVDVVLAGDGRQRAALQQQAFGLANVRFTELPDGAAQAMVLAAADVLLVADPGGPGTDDPGQLPAYLAAGRPVLAATPASSAVACELRRAGEAGRRVDPADPVALAEAMITLQAAPRQRALMGRAALRYARTNLGRAAALRRLEFVVDAALPGRTQEEGR